MSVVLVPSAFLAGQLSALHAAFPAWEFTVESFGTDYWFEARRRTCTVPSCCCNVVAGTAERMQELIVTATGPGARSAT